MKRAEDWIREFSELTPLTQGAVEYVRQIQLDAWSQGMADAANIIKNSVPVEPGRCPENFLTNKAPDITVQSLRRLFYWLMRWRKTNKND